jgi:hypothetical protein
MVTMSTNNALVMLLAFIVAVPLCRAQSGGYSFLIDCDDSSKPPALVIRVEFPYVNVSVDWKDSQNTQKDTIYVNFREGVVESNMFLWQSIIEKYNNTITTTNPIPANVTSYLAFESYNLTVGDGTLYLYRALYLYHTYSQPGMYGPTYNVILPAEMPGGAGMSLNQCWNAISGNGSDCTPDSFSIGSNGRCRVNSSAVTKWSARFLVLLASVSAIGCMV